MDPVALRTERLLLSMPVATDVDAIAEACQDAAIQRFTTVPSPYARSDAEEFVRLVAGWWAEGTQTVWAIREDGALAGMIGLHQISEGAAEIGYWAVAERRGRGLLGEAVRAVVDFGFGDLGLVRLSWRAVAGNVGSARLARSAGFRYEGTLRQAGLHGGHRDDMWIGGLLPSDDRTPVDWPVLD